MEIHDYSSLSYPSNQIPVIPDCDLPLDRQNFEYPQTFSTDFNKCSINAIELYKKNQRNKEVLQDLYFLGPFLFYANWIHPKALTEFFFSSYNRDPKSLIYFFFSSMSLEFVTLVDAMRLLIPRIALPNNMEQLKIIVDSFAEAYYESNQYYSETKKEIADLVIESIMVSLKEEFKLFENEYTSKNMKQSIISELKAKKIPMFFTFVDSDPSMGIKKTGFLSKVGGSVFKRKKRNFFQLESNALHYYKTKENREMFGEIPLDNVEVQYVHAQGKETSHFIIKSINEKPFGTKMSKGKKKESRKNQYTLFADNESEVHEWVYTLKLISFYHTLENFIIRSK